MKQRPVLYDDLHSHPAVAAWAAATPAAAMPQCIHVHREHASSAVYRLEGAAPGGAAVFAKRSLPARTVLERMVYQEVLPRLPLSAPRCYGSWLDESHGWLFVEDVGIERYSREQPEHLAAAARWVGTLHVSAPLAPAARTMPDAGPARYLTHLRSARERILRSRDTFCFTEDEHGRIATLLSGCGALEALWERVEAACAHTPVTLVHGDFQSKNVYLRPSGASVTVLPIDWETVGWGTPATDLADLYLPRVDLRTYASIVREAWQGMDYPAIERLAGVGRVVSGCAAMNWESASLLSDSSRGRSYAVSKLTAIAGLLHTAARSLAMTE